MFSRYSVSSPLTSATASSPSPSRDSSGETLVSSQSSRTSSSQTLTAFSRRLSDSSSNSSRDIAHPQSFGTHEQSKPRPKVLFERRFNNDRRNWDVDTLHFRSIDEFNADPEEAYKFEEKYEAFTQRSIENWARLKQPFPFKENPPSPTPFSRSSPYLLNSFLKSVPENGAEPDTTIQSSPCNSFVSIPDSNSAYFTASNSMANLTQN